MFDVAVFAVNLVGIPALALWWAVVLHTRSASRTQWVNYVVYIIGVGLAQTASVVLWLYLSSRVFGEDSVDQVLDRTLIVVVIGALITVLAGFIAGGIGFARAYRRE